MIPRHFAISAVLAFGLLAHIPAPAWATAASSSQTELLRQQKIEDAKIAEALKRKKAIAAKLKAAEADSKAVKRKKPADVQVKTVSASAKCGSFLECLFGHRRPRVSSSQFGRFQSDSLSTKMSARVVDWNETKYPVGSLIVRTPERALYFVSGEGEAIRYRVGVGREGFQWSGQSRIVAKQEWPSWTPPQEMIAREAEKGIEIPDFMEGGPRNPLGARAMYIGGTIFRVHGTNNESSIGGAVSSGCIRMMNADVVDLYNRVKIGSRIFVYQ